MQYVYWKWAKDISVEKTKRAHKDITNKESYQPDISQHISNHNVFNVNNDAHKNTREECCERISNRELIIQKSVNPYLTNNNYIKDLDDQNDFLIPKDSNYKKKFL